MRNTKSRPGRPQSGKPFFRAALQSDGTLELLVYEDIGESWFSDGGVTAKSVKASMDASGNYDRILVRINSPGGDASEGLAIRNLLRSTKKPVDVYVDGIAASSASIIAMAGDTITMGLGAMLMIHNAFAVAGGDADDHRQLADVLDTVSASIAQVYAQRTGKNLDEVQSLMDAESWFNAQECLDNGFATAITEEPDVQIESSALALARQFKALRKMKHVPAALKRGASARDEECECDCASCLAGDCSACSNADCDDAVCAENGCPMQDDDADARVDLTGWHEKLGLPAPVSIDQARAALEEIDAHAAAAINLDDARSHVEAIEDVLHSPEDEAVDPDASRRYASATGRW